VPVVEGNSSGKPQVSRELSTLAPRSLMLHRSNNKQNIIHDLGVPSDAQTVHNGRLCRKKRVLVLKVFDKSNKQITIHSFQAIPSRTTTTSDMFTGRDTSSPSTALSGASSQHLQRRRFSFLDTRLTDLSRGRSAGAGDSSTSSCSCSSPAMLSPASSSSPELSYTSPGRFSYAAILLL